MARNLSEIGALQLASIRVPWNKGIVNFGVFLKLTKAATLEKGEVYLKPSKDGCYQAAGNLRREFKPSVPSEPLGFRVRVEKLGIDKAPHNAAGLLTLRFRVHVVADQEQYAAEEELTLEVVSPFAGFGVDWHKEGRWPSVAEVWNRAGAIRKARRALNRVDNAVIWLHGLPGCGKTHIVARLMRPDFLAGYTPIYIGIPPGTDWRAWQMLWRIHEANPDHLKASESSYRFTVVTSPLISEFKILESRGLSYLVALDGLYLSGEESPKLFENVLSLVHGLRESKLSPGTVKVVVTDVVSHEERLVRQGYTSEVQDWLKANVVPHIQSVEIGRFTYPEVKSLMCWPFNRQYAPYHVADQLTEELWHQTAGHPLLVAQCLHEARQLYASQPRAVSFGLPRNDTISRIVDRYKLAEVLNDAEKRCLKCLVLAFRQDTAEEYKSAVDLEIKRKDLHCLVTLEEKGIVQKAKDTDRYRLTPAFGSHPEEVRRLWVS